VKPTKKSGIEPQKHGPRSPQASGRDPSRFKKLLIAVLALCAITLLAFSNSFQAGFTLDSKGILLDDPRVREATPQNIDLIFQHTYWWPTGESGLYRPLTTLTYLFNYAVLGNANHSAVYHWINLILHICNVLLVFALALRLVRGFWPSVFIAALWAVHPVLTESVTNIVGRADLLAGFALLSGFMLYLKSTEATGSVRLICLAGLAAVTAVGIFSKESAVAIVGVVACYELIWWRERKHDRGLLFGWIAILVPIVAMLYQRSVVLAASPPAEFPFTDNPLVGADFWTARLTALATIPRYLWLTLWPAKLSSDYSYAAIPLAHGSVQDGIAWAIVAVVIAVVVALYRWNRVAFFMACFAAVTFAPTSNLLFPIGATMAERFLYLPSIGVLACLVMLLYASTERLTITSAMPALVPVALCVIVCGFAVRTWVRNQDWRDDLAMATATIRSTPNSAKAHKLMAHSLFDSDASHSNIDQVIAEAEKALAILDPLPDSRNTPDAYLWAGFYYVTKNELQAQNHDKEGYQRARQILERCLAIGQAGQTAYNRRLEAQGAGIPSASPILAEAHRLLSATYLRLGDTDKASQAAGNALSGDVLNPEGYRRMADVLLANHRAEEAAVVLMRGMFITSDLGLRQDLMNVYRSGIDSQKCAIVAGPNGPAINPACELVHEHICAAAADTIRARLAVGPRDVARTQKKTFLRDYGCPAGPLDSVLPD
jgi:tetratricopeptide (TPR) repeat protein